MFYTRLDLKIGPKSLYLLYLSPRPNGRVKIKLKDITFQNSFLKMPLAIKNEKKKTNVLPTSLSFSHSLILFLILSLFIHFTFLSHINWWDHVN